MSDLDYVALRYFNAYGARMDVHGLYTEVLVRWMERIEAGEPPLIFGDGLQTMDFVYVGDIARANVLAANSDLTDEVFNVASGVETSLLELAEALLQVMDSDLSVVHGPPRAVNGVTRRLADTNAARERLGFEAEVGLLEGLTRLVTWWRVERELADSAAGEGLLMEVPFARPSLTEADGAAVAEAVASGWVSQGPRVAAFEAAYAERVGAPDAVATTNCTTALHLALYVSGVGPGDEVIVPSLSFIATANAVWQCGATPVFADVDPLTYNLDPASAERAITERTKAIMPVHQVGLPADMDAFIALADRYGLELVEDAACAIGAQLQGPADRLAGPAGLLLAAPAQGHHHRRGRHDRRPRPGRGRAPAHAAPARDGPVGPRAPRREGHRLRGLSRARLELPHDRHAGGPRAAPARGAGRHPGRAHAPGRPLRRRARAHPAPRGSLRARVRDAHLAVLLRARGRRTRPSGGPSSCAGCCTTASPRAAA